MDVKMGLGHLTDDEFIGTFERCEFSGEMFHHADHVRLAWLYLRRFGEMGAQARLLAGIQKMAIRKGTPEKFHYTTTVAWLRLIAAARKKNTATVFSEWVAAHPELLDVGSLRIHYRKETLDSAAARHGWIDPDLSPIER